MTADLRSQFLLRPDVTFLNHGSFGATPAPVFEAYQRWQRRLESQPVQFLVTELPQHLAHARQALADLINAHQDDLVYIPNATFGVNLIARSLTLEPDDQVLTTDHEYGACDNAWRFMSQKKGFAYVQQPIPLPLLPHGDLLELFWQGVTPRTKVIFISHITSATAQIMPVKAICACAREAGILTIVDGAHTLGQMDLDLQDIGADFYLSNAHKWLCAPKGAAFLYARRDKQHLLEPLVVGWGWGDQRTIHFGTDFLDYHQWLGTNDLSAYLSVPDAIAFQAEHEWTAVRRRCYHLLQDTLHAIADLTGLNSIYPDDEVGCHQMAVAPLPQLTDLQGFKAALYDHHRIEIPCIEWHGRHFIRPSIQGYNTRSDVDALLAAMQATLPRFTLS